MTTLLGRGSGVSRKKDEESVSQDRKSGAERCAVRITHWCRPGGIEKKWSKDLNLGANATKRKKEFLAGDRKKRNLLKMKFGWGGKTRPSNKSNRKETGEKKTPSFSSRRTGQSVKT